MNIVYAGVQDISGTKKDGGGSYAFCQLLYLVPIRTADTPTRRVHAYGSEIQSVDLDPRTIDQFAGIKVGQEIKVDVSPRPDNMQRNIVIGLIK
jgi:hypothetical protein